MNKRIYKTPLFEVSDFKPEENIAGASMGQLGAQEAANDDGVVKDVF